MGTTLPIRHGGPLQAVVLVGGEGTRLRPLTYRTPKPMVPLFGVPFLERTLLRLKDAGIDHVILAAGYLPAAIRDHFGDGSRLGMRVTYVVEESPLGTAGALKNLAEYITGPFFVLNGDVLTSLDLRKMAAYHKEKGGLGVLHLIRVEDPSAFGCVLHDAEGRVSAFIEKPPVGQAPTNEINAGTYLLEREILDEIPSGRNVSIEREIFPKVLAGTMPLYAFTTSDYWLDVGRPEQYVQAHRDTLDGRMELSFPAPPAGVLTPSYVGDDTVIDTGATVGPYTVLGSNVRVYSGAEVRGSILWDGVHVEAGAHVVDSILASGVRIGAGAQIGPGSVIGHDVSVEPGAVVAPNSRLSAREIAQT